MSENYEFVLILECNRKIGLMPKIGEAGGRECIKDHHAHAASYNGLPANHWHLPVDILSLLRYTMQ